MKITIKGTPEVMAMLGTAEKRIKEGITQGLGEGAELIRGRAAERAPKDTGRLKGSITSKVSGTSAEVGTNVEYAIYQEFGTYKMAAKPYLIPAMEESEAEVAQKIKNAIGL